MFLLELCSECSVPSTANRRTSLYEGKITRCGKRSRYSRKSETATGDYAENERRKKKREEIEAKSCGL